MLLEHVLHLAGGDVLARPLDHVLLPVDEEEPARLVDVGPMAGVKPAVAQPRGLVVAEVALHQGETGHAADDELSGDARRRLAPVAPPAAIGAATAAATEVCRKRRPSMPGWW